MDAEVVKWNYDRFFDKEAPQFYDTAAAFMGYYTRWIESVEVTGPMEVTITLTQPNYEWLQFGVQACGMPMIVSPAQVEKVGNEGFPLAPVGTGPFKFVEREQNIKVVLERFDDYWGKKADIDTLIFRPLPPSSARFRTRRRGSPPCARARST